MVAESAGPSMGPSPCPPPHAVPGPRQPPCGDPRAPQEPPSGGTSAHGGAARLTGRGRGRAGFSHAAGRPPTGSSYAGASPASSGSMWDWTGTAAAAPLPGPDVFPTLLVRLRSFSRSLGLSDPNSLPRALSFAPPLPPSPLPCSALIPSGSSGTRAPTQKSRQQRHASRGAAASPGSPEIPRGCLPCASATVRHRAPPCSGESRRRPVLALGSAACSAPGSSCGHTGAGDPGLTAAGLTPLFPRSGLPRDASLGFGVSSDMRCDSLPCHSPGLPRGHFNGREGVSVFYPVFPS